MIKDSTFNKPGFDIRRNTPIFYRQVDNDNDIQSLPVFRFGLRSRAIVHLDFASFNKQTSKDFHRWLLSQKVVEEKPIIYASNPAIEYKSELKQILKEYFIVATSLGPIATLKHHFIRCNNDRDKSNAIFQLIDPFFSTGRKIVYFKTYATMNRVYKKIIQNYEELTDYIFMLNDPTQIFDYEFYEFAEPLKNFSLKENAILFVADSQLRNWGFLHNKLNTIINYDFCDVNTFWKRNGYV